MNVFGKRISVRNIIIYSLIGLVELACILLIAAAWREHGLLAMVFLFIPSFFAQSMVNRMVQENRERNEVQ